MTAKEYLKRIRQYRYQINQYYLRIEELYTLVNPNAIDYSRDKVQTSPSNKIEDVLIQINELKEKRLSKILEMEQYIDLAAGQINDLGNERYIEVLTERYINCKRYEQIAEQMCLENQTIRKTCVEGLKIFDKIHKDFLKNC